MKQITIKNEIYLEQYGSLRNNPNTNLQTLSGLCTTLRGQLQPSLLQISALKKQQGCFEKTTDQHWQI